MTDPGSTPSHDIESLAARAKEMLERVQGATAPVSASEPSEPEVTEAEEHSETSEIADTDATVLAELDEVAEAETEEDASDEVGGLFDDVDAGDAALDDEPSDLEDIADADLLEEAADVPDAEISEAEDAALEDIEIEGSEIERVDVEDLEVEVEDVEVEVEDVEWPSIELPDSTLATSDLGDLGDLGDLDAPELPDGELPKLDDIEIPDLPDTELPDLPDTTFTAIGDVDLPEIELPDLDVPEAPDFDDLDLSGSELDIDAELDTELDAEDADLDLDLDVDTDVDLDAAVDTDLDLDEPFDALSAAPTDVADQIVSELGADLDTELDMVTGLDEDIDTSTPASTAGLSLEEEPGFVNVDFGDILADGDTVASESEDTPAGTSFVSSMDPELVSELKPEPTNSVELVGVANRPEPAYSARGNVDELFLDEEEDVTAASGGGCGLRAMLVALALVALFLVFFGDQFVDWITADDPVEETDEIGADDDGDSEVDDGEGDGGDANTETASGEDTSTTEATTSSTAAPATTAETTTTEPPLPATAWELLGADSNTSAFASLGGPLGLETRLSSLTDYTVFAPSDSAIAQLTPEQLGALAADPEQANALLEYHVVNGQFTAADLLANDGGQLESINGLPVLVTVDGDTVVLNGSTRVEAADFNAASSTVHVIDSVLEAPTINQVLNLGNIQFEVISSRLTPQGIAELDKAVAFFNENPDAQALIEGHTDTDGDADANQRLSERRANAVRQYLIDQGISGDRLEAQGFGESQPILIDGVEDKVASRRIEFVLR